MENVYDYLVLLEKVSNKAMHMVSYWRPDGRRLYTNLPFENWSKLNNAEALIKGRITLMASQGLPAEPLTISTPILSGTGSSVSYYKVSFIPDIEEEVLRGYIVRVDPPCDSESNRQTDPDRILESSAHKEGRQERTATQAWESILETISESFCVIDRNWNIQYWNNSAERTTGQSKEDIIGKNMWEVFHKEKHSPLYSNCLEAMRSRRHIAFEHNSITGTWYYNSVHPNKDGGITIHFKDITDRKDAENQVAELHNNLDALLNATDDLMWSIDAEYHLVSANKALLEYVAVRQGYSLNIGDNIVVDPRSGDLHKEWIDLYRRCLAGETFSTSTLKMGNRLTRFNPIRSSGGTIMGVACHSVDMSEINRLQWENSASAERFQALVQNGSDFIFIFGLNYQLEYASPSALAVLGQKSIESRQLIGLVHPDDYAAVLWQFRESVRQKTFKVSPFRILDAHGRYIWIEAIVDNLIHNAAVAGVVVNARDVTAAYEKESEREALIGELVKINSDLTKFSYITSHNLRGPLSNILGILRHMDRSQLTPESMTCLSMLDVSASDLNRTMEDLSEVLQVRDIRHVWAEKLDICECFHNANMAFERQEVEIGASVELHMHERKAFFNKHYLENIFSTLISNAIKFRSPKRKLNITVSAQKDSDGTVQVQFSDNGLGFDSERHRDRIFGMYQRFHEGAEGKGLGLFLVQAQLKALGGTITVESTVDRQTAFTIVLPS